MMKLAVFAGCLALALGADVVVLTESNFDSRLEGEEIALVGTSAQLFVTLSID